METFQVLVADDLRSMRNVIKSILRNIGFANIYDAEDGQQSLNVLRKETIHLVVCDWNMPKMTGLELLETMRADSNLADIPFIMVTAENSKERITQAIEAGTDEYVVKPFNEETLRKKIANALRRHSS